MNTASSQPQTSSGPHSHDGGTAHAHRTWPEFHGHDGLPAGAGDLVPVAVTQEDFDALRVALVEQGVHPDLATMAARAKLEARPFG